MSTNEEISKYESNQEINAQTAVPRPVQVNIELISNQQLRKNQKNKIFKIILVMGVLIGVILIIIVGVVNLGKKFINRGENGTTLNNEEVVLTPTLVNEQGSNLMFLKTDSDNDGIPDLIESKFGYDPQTNDCVRSAGCGEISGSLPRAKLRLNVVFVIDVSGSMDSDTAGQNKWESAKSALGDLFNKKFPKYMDVGVVMYGHLGSSSENDKQISCQGVEVVKPLTPLEDGQINNLLSDKSPKGWTPLASSLEKAGELLADRQGEGNYIVVLSDGLETCGGDPVAVAKKLHDSGIEVTTNVVGLALNAEEKRQLEAIASSGGGGFFPADEPQELARALSLSTDALLRWDELNRCIAENAVIYSQCVGTQYLQCLNEVKSLKLEFIEQNAPAVGGRGVVDVRLYSEAEDKILRTYEKLRQENWDLYRRDLELIAPR